MNEKDKQNQLLLDNIKAILDCRDVEKIYTITIEIHGNIGALISVDIDAMKEGYEGEECECYCGECAVDEVEEIISFLKSKGFKTTIVDNRNS